jgi:hypothetical protein
MTKIQVNDETLSIQLVVSSANNPRFAYKAQIVNDSAQCRGHSRTSLIIKHKM